MIPSYESPEHARFHIEWAQQFERQVRVSEREFIGSLLRAAISDNQHVELQHALRKLQARDDRRIASDDTASRTAGTLVHLLLSFLVDDEQAAA